MSDHASPEIELRQAEMHIYRPTEPVTVKVVRNELCTASKKSAGWVRHIEFDVSGTKLAGKVLPGQSIGVLAEGLDAMGKPHKLRLYSVAHPTRGEDGAGNIISVTVKRAIDEHWDNKKLFLGVCSNYLCDRQVGDEVRISGPNGKKFVLPVRANDHNYLFFATGTGIAPFRGMIIDLLESGFTGKVALLMGSPYTTDLLYHDQLLELARKHANFMYLPAISRELNPPHGKLYVQERLRTDASTLLPLLEHGRGLIYICGLAGMEMGIFQQLASQLPPETLAHYLSVEPEAMKDIKSWQRSMLHKQIKPSRRVFMEVYA
jgi:ferredoxin--NADP+ reductase